jgi:restriction endonuclease S subunit
MAEGLQKGWRLLRFEQMAVMVNDRVDNPADAGVDRYVGLEHLDSESLSIRRWGVPTDVGATKLRFRKGDIIFGRRRVYQRKLAVADFDGICSAHAMVIRANPDGILPEFLPFFMQSDYFMERAKQISVGSLSPTINWKALAEQEFALPPLEEQRRIAEGLAALHSALDHYRMTRETIAVLADAWLAWELGDARQEEPLGDVLQRVQYGCSRASNTRRQGVPILGIPNVLRGQLDLDDLKRVLISEDEARRYLLHQGDILVVRTNGNPAYVGRCLVVPILPEPMVFASYLIRLVVDPSRARPEYVERVLNSRAVRRKLRPLVRSSAGNFNVNAGGIRNLGVPMPAVSQQDRILADLGKFQEAESHCLHRSRELAAIQKAMMGALET